MTLNLWLGGLALALLTVSVPAQATLGEDAGSVASDQLQLQAALQVTNSAKFAVHRLQLPSGTTVREYVTPAGLVFAVSWQGASMPDLQQLLGRYFESYSGAVQRQAGRGGARTSEQPDLVVRTGGHMRAFFGKVYVAPMLPRGVLEEEIQ